MTCPAELMPEITTQQACDDSTMRRDAADKEFEELMALMKEDVESIATGDYFIHPKKGKSSTAKGRKMGGNSAAKNTTTISSDATKKKLQKVGANSSAVSICSNEMNKTGTSAATATSSSSTTTTTTTTTSSSTTTTTSMAAPAHAAVSAANEPVVLKEICKSLCVALGSGDKDLTREVFTEHTLPDLIVFHKWMGANALNRSHTLKQATTRNREIFLALWASRHVQIPDATLKFHFPFKYHRRVDGGMTVSASVLLNGTKVMESKNLLLNKANSSVLDVEVNQALARPRYTNESAVDADVSMSNMDSAASTGATSIAIRTGKADPIVATASLRGPVIRCGDKGGTSAKVKAEGEDEDSTTSSPPLPSINTSVFDDMYVLEQPVIMCCYGTMSFHFNKTTEKLFELDMLWHN